MTRDIQQYGQIIFQPRTDRHDYNFIGDDDLLIGEVKPVGLLMRGFQHFKTLLGVLAICDTSVNELQPSGRMHVVSVNINSYIKDGKKLVDSLPVGTKTISLPHPLDHSKSMIYKLGKSLPNRNKLASLVRSNANFYLVHWEETVNITRYAVYITTESGSAIYCNYYTDLLIK